MRNFLFIVSSLYVVSCSNGEEKVKPKIQNITESVYSSITIQPDSMYQVYAVVSGILDENLVEEGDLVIANEAILQIINNAPLLNTENAKLSLELAKENYEGNAAVLSSIKEEIEAANLKFNNDSINYVRQKNLWSQKIGSKVDYDTKKLNYELSKNNLDLLKNKYKQTKNQLSTNLKQARNNYQSTIINTKDFTVKSKINGKVYALFKEPGEIVNTMEPLAAIGSSHAFVIEMLVDEVDIVKIRTQQEVLITLDAYKNDLFRAKISKIFPKKDERNQTFKVEAVFVEEPKVLYPGLSGEGNIIISKKEDALVIPKRFLIGDDKVKTEDGLVTIQKGLENLELVEVISGITKDTYIYKPD